VSAAHSGVCMYVPTFTHAHIPPLPDTPEDAVEAWERLGGEGERDWHLVAEH